MASRKAKGKVAIPEEPPEVRGVSALQTDFDTLNTVVSDLVSEIDMLTTTISPLVTPSTFEEATMDSASVADASIVPPTSTNAVGYQNQLRTMSANLEKRARWLAQIRRNFVG